MIRSTMTAADLVAKLTLKDFGDDNLAVAIVREALRLTTSDIKWSRSIHVHKTPLQKEFALEDAKDEAIHMVGGLLGYIGQRASAA
jgi:hypothetical protein